MRNIETATQVTCEDVMTNSPVVYERNLASQEYWSQRSLKNVAEEMPQTLHTSRADYAVVYPDGAEVDESETLVLPLEFSQGITPAHVMRARTVQQIAAPNSRVLILPNSSRDSAHVSLIFLSEKDRRKMANGDYMPYAENLVRAVEQANMVHSFGRLAMVGSSQGALTGLAMASKDTLDVVSVLAFETPSKTDRSAKELQKDFRISGGGVTGLWKAIKDSNIPAQREAMRFPDRYFRDIAKFVIHSVTDDDAKLVAQSMAGSAEYLAAPAVSSIGGESILFAHVEGSTVYDPESLSDETLADSRHLQIVGDKARAHATSNNLPLLGALAYESRQ